MFEIVLSGPADRDVTVEFMTMDDSARGKILNLPNCLSSYTIIIYFVVL